MCYARSSLADCRQQRRSRGSYTSVLSMMWWGHKTWLCCWRSSLGCRGGGGQLLAGPLQLFDVPRTILVRLFAFSSFPAQCCWLWFWQDFAPPIIYQHSTARPQEMSLKSHFPLESKCLHNMANFGKRAYQKETLGAKTLKSNNM